jgi:membrane-associated phospholipid phosphatase
VCVLSSFYSRLVPSDTRRRVALVGLLVMLISALALSAAAYRMAHLPLDPQILRFIQSLSAPWVDFLIEPVIFLGQRHVAVISVFILAVWLALARRWEEVFAFLAVLLLDGAVQVIKATIGRARPPEDLLHLVSGASAGPGFPSGHVYHAVVFWGLFLVLVVSRFSNPWLRGSAICIVVALIVLTALSRIYLGVHWPSDVAGSIAMGVPSVIVVSYLSRKLKMYRIRG